MKNNQAGGVVSFIIVALVLAGLFAGGLYWSKQQGREARENTQSQPVATSDKQKQSDAKKEDSQSKPDASAGQNNTQGSTQGTANNSATPKPAAPPAQNSRQAGSRGVAVTGPSGDGGEIPATGPAETVATTFGLAVIAFTLYRLVHSRRSVRQSALNR